MTSQIDVTKPVAGTPTTGSVRDNFTYAKSEIEALQVTAAALPATYQPLNTTLTALAALTTAANKLIYATGSATFSTTDLSAFARTVLDDADASAVRTTLGLVIGTNVQAQDAELAAIAGLTSAADRVPYFTGSGTAALATFTTAGRALVDDADAAAQLATLGIIVPYFYATRSSSQTLTADAFTKVQLSTEVLDSAGAYDAATNYRFTPLTAGYYLVAFGGQVDAASAESAGVAVYKNGSLYDYGLAAAIPGGASSALSLLGVTLVQLNGSTDYIELFGLASNNATPTIVKSFMAGLRIA